MTDLSKWANLNINRDRYEKINREWKTKISKTVDMSFTEWVTTIMESSLLKYRFIAKVFPNFRVISVDNAFIIENTEKNVVVKVFLNNGKIDCTATENKEDYIIFACLHPLFSL